MVEECVYTGGGGGDTWYFKSGSLTGGTALSVSITGKAKKVYFQTTFPALYSNCNPSTGKPTTSDECWWFENNAWTKFTNGNHFVLTDGNIGMSASISSATQSWIMMYTLE